MRPERSAYAGRRPRRRFPAAPVVMGVGLGGVALAAGVWLALRSPASATAPPVLPAASVGRAERGDGPRPPSGHPTGTVTPPAPSPPIDEGAALEGDPVVAPPNGGGLTRADVVAGIAAVRPQLAGCPHDRPLLGLVRMTVAASGKVSAVQVHGALAGTPAGSCVAAIARDASFRPSRREQTVIRWPIAIGRGRGGAVDYRGVGDTGEAGDPTADEVPGPETLAPR